MNFSWNTNTKCKRSLCLLFQRTLFLIFPLFQKYLNPQVRTNKFVGCVVYHPCLSRLASRMLAKFSITCIFHHVWERFFNLYDDRIPRKCIESMHFYSYPSPPLKIPGRIFWKSVFPRTEGFALFYQNSIKKYEDDLEHIDLLYFVWFVIFLNLMALQFCE